MAFKVIYKIIFEVQILHEYFLNKGEKNFDELPQNEKDGVMKKYEVQEIFDVQPTAECEKQLKKFRLAFKKSKTGFFVVAEVKALKQVPAKADSYAPIIPFDETFHLTFSLSLKDPYFYSYTVLPFDSSGSEIYFFSNRKGKNGATYPSISEPISGYQTKRAYNAGDLVVDNNKLYEARINMTASNNSSFKQKNWKQFNNKNYVNENDKILRKRGSYDYIFSQQGITNAQFIIQNSKGDPIFREEIESNKVKPFTRYPLILSNLPSGYYTLTVKGNDAYHDTTSFYLEKAIMPTHTFGIVEIVHLLQNGLGDYKLLDPGRNNELVYPVSPEDGKKPVYQLLFKNRSTILRYIFSQDQEVTNSQLGGFKPDGGSEEKRKFLTKESKPLTLYPYTLQKFNQPDKLLLGASKYNLKPEKNTIYSEIYI